MIFCSRAMRRKSVTEGVTRLCGTPRICSDLYGPATIVKGSSRSKIRSLSVHSTCTISGPGAAR